MRLPDNWQERFYAVYERARLREIARLDAVAGRVDPFIGDPHHLCALRLLIASIPSRCTSLSEAARVAAAEYLRDVADLVEHRRQF